MRLSRQPALLHGRYRWSRPGERWPGSWTNIERKLNEPYVFTVYGADDTGAAIAGLVPSVEALSALLELADAWVRAGKLPWHQTLALVFQTEGEVREAVGLGVRPRSQGLRATADVVARSLTDGTQGNVGTAPNVPAAINMIVEQIVGFPGTFIQIASAFERSLLEPPPPAQVSVASQLVKALVELTFVGASAGVALRVASALGAQLIGRSQPDIPLVAKRMASRDRPGCTEAGTVATRPIGSRPAPRGRSHRSRGRSHPPRGLVRRRASPARTGCHPLALAQAAAATRPGPAAWVAAEGTQVAAEGTRRPDRQEVRRSGSSGARERDGVARQRREPERVGVGGAGGATARNRRQRSSPVASGGCRACSAARGYSLLNSR